MGRRVVGRFICLLALTAVAGSACIGGGREINPSFNALGKPGGKLLIAGAGKLDGLDPGRMLSSTSGFLARGVFRTLVTFSATRESGGEGSIVPDLATNIGTPNETSTWWTFELRDGIVFGPGLGGEEIDGVTGKEITSGDVKYAVERLFRLSPASGTADYFTRIEGAEAYADGTADTISGIKTPDDKTIVFELTEPTGDWPYRMTLPATSPVPAQYARSLDLPGGSDYADHVVATGPYYVDGWVPGEQLQLKRNSLWESSDDSVRAAFVDEVEWEFGFQGPEAINTQDSEKIVGGRFDVVEGAGPDEVLLGSGFKRNIVSAPALCTRYLWLNTKIAPFDDKRVRRAVALAINRERLLDAQGGPDTGDVATSVLPPGVPGHLTPDEYSPYATPSMAGDIKKAKKILAKAGFADGYSGSVLIVGSNESPEDAYAKAVKADLRKLGFSNARIKLVAPSKLFTAYYATATSKKVAVGTSGGRCREYLDASSFFEPLLESDDEDDSGSLDAFGFGGVSDKGLAEALSRAEGTAPGPERAAAWEKVNRIVTEDAAVVPWSWDKRRILYNRARLQNPIYNRSYSGLDWPLAVINTR